MTGKKLVGKGEVDYDFALKIKEKTSIPVIFSGVSNLNDVEKILRDFDFVMIGRKAIGNPLVFQLLGNKKKGIGNKDVGFKEYLELAKKYGLYFRQVKYQAMNFTKGLADGKKLRGDLVGAKTLEDVENIMGRNK